MKNSRTSQPPEDLTRLEEFPQGASYDVGEENVESCPPSAASAVGPASYPPKTGGQDSLVSPVNSCKHYAMSYAKLFSSITESTLWSEPKETRLLFVSMLARCDQVGFIEASIPGLCRLANLTREEVEASLARLEGPDPDSKNPDNDGRRIIKVQGGWTLLNYESYRNRMSDSERREYMREYMRGYRKERKHDVKSVNTRKLRLANVKQADAVCLTAPAPAPAQGILRYAQDGPPAPGAADAALSHSADAPVKGVGRKKLPGKQKPPSKRWHPDSEVFLDLWGVAFRDFFGFDYSRSARDKGWANELLHQNPNSKPMEIVEIAKRAWQSDRFVCQRARSFSVFASEFNPIRCELQQPAQRSSRKKLESEIADLLHDLAIETDPAKGEPMEARLKAARKELDLLP